MSKNTTNPSGSLLFSELFEANELGCGFKEVLKKSVFAMLKAEYGLSSK